MLSLVDKCCHAVGNGDGMMDLVDSYNELRVHDGVEFVFVPIIKGQTECSIGRCSLCSEEECFNNLFSKMPWPAVRFSDKQKCNRIETMLWPSPLFLHLPYFIIFDPKGNVLLTNAYRYNPALSIFHLYGGADLFSLADLSLQNLEERDKETIKKLDLDQLLESPYRSFLLARDGTKVPVSSLRDKVVGLYFCDNQPTPPPRMEALKKVYQEAMDMGCDFEIVQINFHFRNNYEHFPHNKEMPLQVWCHDVPWLTLPYKDVCCRRLRRLFKWHHFDWYVGDWKGDSLVIIDPHNFNIDGTRYERHAIQIIKHFGIEAYPFTRKRVVDLEYAKLREVKLHMIFPLGGPPLIRPSTSRGCDQVPRSELFGKPVYVLFSPHLKYTPYNNTFSKLESKYSSQSGSGVKFEVVYVSCDCDESTFDEFIKEMPWLVHPCSCEFGMRWIRQFGRYCDVISTLLFDAGGELVMSSDSMLQDIATFHGVLDADFIFYR